ncbi:MAG TPA: molybdenum cofactor biosynthesis protein MoaE [Syntrophorhabdaceae bacterium]
MIDRWIEEIKKNFDPDEIGMMLAHNGIVRGTSKEGRPVKGMILSYDKELLEKTVKEFKRREGIAEIRAWINEGELYVGDDIMFLLVAGRFRTDVLPALQELLSVVKKEIVHEKEIG